MSFESGSDSFRMFYVVPGLPEDALEKFARNAAPPLKTLGVEQIQGWVGGRHLLDLPIAEENAFFGGHLRLTLMKAERKIPTSLLRAECMMEEIAWMRAENKPFVDRKTRAEIRKEVTDRLHPQMPPTLKGLPFVHDERGGVLYANATSDKQTDALRVNWLRTLGMELIPVAAATAAAKRRGVDVREWSKTSFSPEVPDSEMEEAPGLDFLTWLWFLSEAHGGIFTSSELGDCAVALEGPLLFTREGNGAHETSLRKGMPTVSAEAKTALLGGKKLRRAKLTLARTDETWSCSFDADAFVFRGLKMPEPKEMLDPVSRFQDRMTKLGLFRDVFFELFDLFLEDRGNPKNWAAAKKQIHRWVADRTTKR